MKRNIEIQKINRCRDDRFEMHEKLFSECKQKLGEECLSELRRLYDVYDENNYIWLSELWDSNIGGFYFSASARDTDGFLPDIESTMGALRYIELSGLNSSRAGKSIAAATPGKMREKLIGFTKGLQDQDDGYFYHPQWGRRISTSRRGRDLGWSTALLREFNDKPPYKTPLDRADKNEMSPSLPEHLSSLKAFEEYLRGLNFTTHSYWNGSLLQSQQRQIKAAGDEFVELMFSHLEAIQRFDNGLWGEQINYSSVNGLMKINLMYTFFERPLPYAELALKNTLKVALSDEQIVYCTQFYNPLITIEQILKNIEKFGNEKLADSLRSAIKKNAAELIAITRRKVEPCKRSDGAFSYFYERGCEASQGAPVSLGVLESDVNASYLSSVGVSNYICSILEIPEIPLFGIEDSRLFYELLENVKVTPKLYAKPEWFDSKLV